MISKSGIKQPFSCLNEIVFRLHETKYTVWAFGWSFFSVLGRGAVIEGKLTLYPQPL